MATSLKIRSLCCHLIRAAPTTLILVLLVSTQTISSTPPLAAAAARQVQWHRHASSLLPKAPSVVVAPNKYIVPAVVARSSPLRASLFFYPTNYRMMLRVTMTDESGNSPAGNSPGMGHHNPPCALSSSSSSSSSIMPPPERPDPRP